MKESRYGCTHCGYTGDRCDVNEVGERTCPECGKPGLQVYTITIPMRQIMGRTAQHRLGLHDNEDSPVDGCLLCEDNSED